MNVAVIFGGKSTEHDVSCMSAASILDNISGHNVIKIGVTLDGKWFLTEATNEQIRKNEWEKCDKKQIFADLSALKLVCDGKNLDIDVAFPIIHGRNGEDGRLQGLLEMLKIKYVGPGVLGSAVCMDKITANKLFGTVGIPHAEWIYFTKSEYLSDKNGILSKTERLGYPVFVKPSNAGSSIGITKVHEKSELEDAINLAFENDSRVLVEKSIENCKEIEIAVMGNDFPQTSSTGRVLSANESYDYEAKYFSPDSKTLIPSGISDEQEKTIKEYAVKAYKACDCRGLSRVDFLIGEDGEVYLNEINTLPGFTNISMYPKLFIAVGYEYSEIINKLIEYAVE